jgi:hypothetical protein
MVAKSNFYRPLWILVRPEYQGMVAEISGPVRPEVQRTVEGSSFCQPRALWDHIGGGNGCGNWFLLCLISHFPLHWAAGRYIIG